MARLEDADAALPAALRRAAAAAVAAPRPGPVLETQRHQADVENVGGDTHGTNVAGNFGDN